MIKNNGCVSSPGRICLFGEHQDYLGLPVIPIAINKRLHLNYQFKGQESYLTFKSNQIENEETIQLIRKPKLTGSPFDYLISVIIFLWDNLRKYQLPRNIYLDSQIPIKAGLSSSAALLTSMVFLMKNIIMEESLDKTTIAEISYQCEHDIMKISCGRMDQYASSIGGIFFMTSDEDPGITALNFPKRTFFVIGNSEIERKADIPLKLIQKEIFRILVTNNINDLEKLSPQSPSFRNLSLKHQRLLKGIIGIRDITLEALDILNKHNPDLYEIGNLINKQHLLLSSNYRVSHQKLDKMCEIANKSGALGSKLTGAGFGGCMFALASGIENARQIKKELQNFGSCFITKMDTGVKVC